MILFLLEDAFNVAVHPNEASLKMSYDNEASNPVFWIFPALISTFPVAAPKLATASTPTRY